MVILELEELLFYLKVSDGKCVHLRTEVCRTPSVGVLQPGKVCSPRKGRNGFGSVANEEAVS